MTGRYYATVSVGEATWPCVYDSKLGFMCGRCRKQLGHRPQVGDHCPKCSARVEEAMYPAKKQTEGN